MCLNQIDWLVIEEAHQTVLTDSDSGGDSE